MTKTLSGPDPRIPAHLALKTFIVAIVFNYPWELAQSHLYVEGANIRAMWWHCLVASLGDGFLVLLIFAAGWLTWRKADWFAQPGARRYGLMLAAGLILGAAVEWVALHLLQRWSYAADMPRVPGLDIGIVPLVQMLALPPVVFRVVAAWRTRLVSRR